jgi:hypothetical protein
VSEAFPRASYACPLRRRASRSRKTRHRLCVLYWRGAVGARRLIAAATGRGIDRFRPLEIGTARFDQPLADFREANFFITMMRGAAETNCGAGDLSQARTSMESRPVGGFFRMAIRDEPARQHRRPRRFVQDRRHLPLLGPLSDGPRVTRHPRRMQTVCGMSNRRLIL